MERNAALSITDVTRHRYYCKPQNRQGGRPRICFTPKLQEGAVERVADNEVIARLLELKSDPSADHGYQKTARRRS